ncbi:hypothetical protein CH330_02375 [candidate division WOR-3 bacterium JGI_Cruoil_03_51_56]|uniref:histidine kinase n=1 Tax=candidate division WOR-3 bacterium JGI_Cruoil_03_51_56 TaxID=1973747 RepID=A0A235BWL6_UNCW3|nr:MAG: hypothetical protein CH330_02375 [candidate division WOR-3 bacterium JGI_Cruoil_03_51_56]
MEISTFEAIITGQEFLNELQEGIWVADEHGSIVFANPSLARLLGYDNTKVLVGKAWREMFPSTEAARLGKSKPQGDMRIVSDSVILGCNNQVIPASVAVVRKTVNSTTWYLGSVIPTSKPSRPSDLMDSTSRQVMDYAVDGICAIEKGRIIYVNHRFEELTGYTVKQLSCMNPEKLVAPRNRRTITQVITQPQTVLLPIHHEVRIITKDGHKLDCELRIVPTETNTHTVLLCFLRDISQLRRAQRAQTDFIATVSHELRTPLAAIKEAMSLLSETTTGVLEDRQCRYLAIAREEINRLNRMITNLIEASRMESGKVTLRLEPVNLEEVLSKSLESLSLFINKKNLKVNKQLPAKLPLVLADRDRLLQVFNNLLDNAIKYTPTDSSISISARVINPDAPVLSENNVLPGTGYIQVNISDTGPGIPAEFLDRIFGKFERVDPHGPGIGLGLAIVQSIIQMHHGKVWAHSTLGEETSFSFILPLKESHE